MTDILIQLSTIGTKRPFMCWCASKNLHTHSLTHSIVHANNSSSQLNEWYNMTELTSQRNYWHARARGVQVDNGRWGKPPCGAQWHTPQRIAHASNPTLWLIMTAIIIIYTGLHFLGWVFRSVPSSDWAKVKPNSEVNFFCSNSVRTSDWAKDWANRLVWSSEVCCGLSRHEFQPSDLFSGHTLTSIHFQLWTFG